MVVTNPSGISFEDQILLLMEHLYNQGITEISFDDVEDFLKYRISHMRASNILRTLYDHHFVSRVKSDKSTAGNRRYLYKINKAGRKRCALLHTQGSKLEDL